MLKMIRFVSETMQELSLAELMQVGVNACFDCATSDAWIVGCQGIYTWLVFCWLWCVALFLDKPPVIHGVLVLFQATTLNVAFNSHNKALLTIMMANNVSVLRRCRYIILCEYFDYAWKNVAFVRLSAWYKGYRYVIFLSVQQVFMAYSYK